MNINQDRRVQPESLDFSQRNQNNFQHLELTPADIKEWRKCLRDSLYKMGLPLAITTQLLISYYKTGKLQMRPFNIFGFVTNLILGSMVYAPICFKNKYLLMHGNDKLLLEKEQEESIGYKSEENVPQIDEVNFQSNLDPNLDGPEQGFSHLHLDFGSSNAQLESDEVLNDKSKTSQPSFSTTYEDLRRQNRETHIKSVTNFSFDSFERKRNDLPKPVITQKPEKTEQKNTLKNKYGDDMEL